MIATGIITVSRLAAYCFVASVLTSPLLAHHSFYAEFDPSHPIKVTGTITRVEWENPHVWYYLDVKGADGKVTTWGFSANAPGQMMRSGVTKEMFKPGIMLTVEGFRAKDGSNNANSQKVTLPDRKTVVTGTQGDSTNQP
jgi:Family of unknown function (DUF6152)